MKSSNIKKEAWEGLVALLLLVLAVLALREFFRNDRNQLISSRGKQVLNDDELMKLVNRELKKHEEQGISGPVVVDLH